MCVSQEILDRTAHLETTCADLEKERSELSQRLVQLKGADNASEEMRQAIRMKDRDIADVRKHFFSGVCAMPGAGRGESFNSEAAVKVEIS